MVNKVSRITGNIFFIMMGKINFRFINDSFAGSVITFTGTNVKLI